MVHFSSVEKARLAVLKLQELEPPKYLHQETLAELGFLHCITQMLERARLGQFLGLTAPAYPKLTREFAATLAVTSDEDGDVESISFKYRHSIYVVDVDRIRAALGIDEPPSLGWRNAVTPLAAKEVWGAVTQTQFRGGQSTSISYTHPCLRLLHLSLMRHFFGQSQANKVTLPSMTALFCALPQFDATPDWVSIFCDGVFALRDHPSRTITQGGMITLICRGVIPDHKLVDPIAPEWMDITHLRNSRMLTVTGGRYCWTAKEHRAHQFGVPRPLPYSDNVEDWYIPEDVPRAADVTSGPVTRRRQHTERGESSRARRDTNLRPCTRSMGRWPSLTPSEDDVSAGRRSDFSGSHHSHGTSGFEPPRATSYHGEMPEWLAPYFARSVRFEEDARASLEHLRSSVEYVQGEVDRQGVILESVARQQHESYDYEDYNVAYDNDHNDY